MYVSNIDPTPNTGSCCIVSVSFFTAVFLSLVTFSLSLFFFFFFGAGLKSCLFSLLVIHKGIYTVTLMCMSLIFRRLVFVISLREMYCQSV